MERGLPHGEATRRAFGWTTCRALQASERTLGSEHPSTLVSMNNLASLLQDQGKLAEAEPLFRRALETQQLTLGSEHPDTLTSLSNLASLLQDQGKLAEAEPLYRRALEARERTLGLEHLDTLISVNNLAWMCLELRRAREADPLFHRCSAASTDRGSYEHLWPRLGLALCDVLDSGEPAPAEAVIAELAAMLGPDHDRVTKARKRLAKAVERVP